jgi:hypothetical protein
MEEFPDAVLDFIEEAITLDHPLLPCHYPADGDLVEFQGLVSDESWSDCPDSWWPVCHNEAVDPYFVDVTEPGHPVYFLFRAVGRWEPILVTDTLADFSDILVQLQDREADPREAAEWVERHLDPDHDLWADVAEGYRRSLDRPASRRTANMTADADAYILARAMALDPDRIA